MTVTINFQALVEHSPIGVFLSDAAGRCRYTNTAWQMMFGMSLHESLGDGWLKTLHIDDRERVIQGWTSAVQEQREFAMEFCTRFDDGKVRFILSRARPLFKNGVVQAYLGGVEDITDRHVLQQVVSERERSYSRLLSNLSGMAYRCCGENTRAMIYASLGSELLTGFSPSELVSANALPFNSLIHPDDINLVAGKILQAIAKKTSFVCEYRVFTKKKELKWVWDQGEGVFDSLGKLLFVEGLITDISAQKKVENALREERNLLSAIINSSTDFIFAKDKNLRTFLCNNIFASALDKVPEELYGKTDLENGWPEELVKGNPAKGIRGYEQDDLEALRGEVVHNHRDLARMQGELRVYDTIKLPIRDSAGEIMGILGVSRDITEASLAAEKIWYQANYDGLTGLPNRRMFSDRLRHQIQKSEREKSSFALLFVDLDYFKDVNDTLGHDIGDQLLVAVAQRISRCVRSSDTVSRFGGDEFTLLLPDLRSPQDVEKIYESILKSLSEPFILEGERIAISASIGATIYPDDSEDFSTLLKFADQAMYQAKQSGRNRFCFFTPSLQESAVRHRRLSTDLRAALGECQLELFFQPIISLVNGEVHKAEALIRWRHPVFGLLVPLDFIPLAEEVGLIGALGNWVFKTAADQAKIWRESYADDFQICINKSPAQFHDENNHVENDWKAYLDNCGLAGNSVSVEITESMLLDEAPCVINKLLSFRDAGIQVALDDFGTGYSALSYLRKFDIDYIKIDRSFISNIEKNKDDLVLCEAIIAMAHKLGLKVVAEGIETFEQYRLMRTLDCDFAQGFYFSKPMSSENFEKYMVAARCNIEVIP